MLTINRDYDVIVAGAGSAGCALAYRLAASSDLNVLLLEAGTAGRHPLLHIPLGFAFLLKPNRYNWGYRTTPEPGLHQREVDLPRGKVLGGCSSINGMVYVRGQAEDYDRWAALGNAGWSYREVLPYFKRSEDCAGGADDYHATGGPLWVGPVNTRFPICDAFIEAARQAGHPGNGDINGASQEGVGYFPTNIKGGRRCSAARAFLDAGRALGNLTVLTGATVRRVLFEGDRAVGVECLVRNRPQVFRAGREVALCAGAINSPKILELSGVGQAPLHGSQVADRIEVRPQRSVLEDETDPAVRRRHALGATLGDHAPADGHGAGRRLLEAREQTQQSGLAAARRTDQRRPTARGEVEVQRA